MSHTPHIELRGVHKSYPIGGRDFEALRGIDLEVASGEFLGLVGPSGSGKTTLLNLVGGLDAPTRGEIRIDGEPLALSSEDALADYRNRRVGFVFQSFHLLPVYTAFENVEFPLLLQGQTSSEETRRRVMEILDRVGLAKLAEKMPGTLSGGECQRVAIARAMVKDPALVLADEPTANLDSANSHEVLEIMQRLNQESGTTFLFSTHDEKVMGYLRRTVRLTDGRVTGDHVTDPEEVSP